MVTGEVTGEVTVVSQTYVQGLGSLTLTKVDVLSDGTLRDSDGCTVPIDALLDIIVRHPPKYRMIDLTKIQKWEGARLG